jgi:hypothetical protein
MAKTTGRIAISRNPAEMLTLAGKVYTKHLSDGDTSQLEALTDIDWSVVGPTIETALARHNEAESLKGQMEAAYRERDLLLPAIEDSLKSSRNLLKALNAKNPKRLADWGFEVDDTSSSSKTSKP